MALRTPGDTQTLTWRDFASQVRQVAAGLAALGVGRGDTVSLSGTREAGPQAYTIVGIVAGDGTLPGI